MGLLPCRLLPARRRPSPVATLVLAVLFGTVTATSGSPPASAEVSTTTLTVEPPASAYIGTDATVTATLVRAETGAPVVGAEVLLDRRRGGQWRPLAAGVTDAAGVVTATFRVRQQRADNALRASFAGRDGLAAVSTGVVVVQPKRRATEVVVRGPGRIVDETKVRLRMRWRTEAGQPVAGPGVLWRRLGQGAWKRHTRLTFDDQGKARLRVGPRRDSRWKVVGKAGPWWLRDASAVHRIENVPPGEAVAYPARAPRPRVRLPRQARAAGAGPNARVSRIPDRVWRSMRGRSWHPGCPVGRRDLRLVRVNYWGYDGYRYRGELVVRATITPKTAAAFSALYRARLPIRSMYRVDRFGWSATLGGADNYRSMASGNTSAFNCRGVVGNPRVRSPHSYGRAIDLNTWENPYRSRTGVVPNTWWAARSHPRVAWRSARHQVVRIMRAHGFRWSYGTSDAHHFDG